MAMKGRVIESQRNVNKLKHTNIRLSINNGHDKRNEYVYLAMMNMKHVLDFNMFLLLILLIRKKKKLLSVSF